MTNNGVLRDLGEQVNNSKSKMNKECEEPNTHITAIVPKDNDVNQSSAKVNQGSASVTNEQNKQIKKQIKYAYDHTQPKVSTNFDRPTKTINPKPHVHNLVEVSDTTLTHVTLSTDQMKKPQNFIEPPLPAVTHSYATKMRAKLAEERIPIEFTPPKITTKQGLPVVVFKKEDYVIKLVSRC